jgi:phosphohistidine phosphatase
MKSLLLLRHGKPLNLLPGGSDFDRPLTDRGRQTAEIVGSYIGSFGPGLPDLVVSSPAVRARETTEAVLHSAGKSLDVRYDERIYEASAQDLLNVIFDVEKNRERLLVVGHNPGLEELLRILTGRPEAMGPASLARMNLDISEWSECEADKCAFAWIVTPGELESLSETRE